jgi:hypothetical protein
MLGNENPILGKKRDRHSDVICGGSILWATCTAPYAHDGYTLLCRRVIRHHTAHSKSRGGGGDASNLSLCTARTMTKTSDKRGLRGFVPFVAFRAAHVIFEHVSYVTVVCQSTTVSGLHLFQLLWAPAVAPAWP